MKNIECAHENKHHEDCFHCHQAGDCIMPREGVFAKVIEGGSISCNDGIEICCQTC